jgi:hypothetical protein
MYAIWHHVPYSLGNFGSGWIREDRSTKVYEMLIFFVKQVDGKDGKCWTIA